MRPDILQRRAGAHRGRQTAAAARRAAHHVRATASAQEVGFKIVCEINTNRVSRNSIVPPHCDNGGRVLQAKREEARNRNRNPAFQPLEKKNLNVEATCVCVSVCVGVHALVCLSVSQVALY